MFTGIVEEVGKIKDVRQGARSIRMTVECAEITKDIKHGDSIAVNGVCLTVTDFGGNWFSVDVMPETMRRTSLEKLSSGSMANLERALKLGGRLGGHFVSGHIDGTGEISNMEREDNAVWMTVKCTPDILKYIVHKGSIAIDGTSLTVAFIDDVSFKVSLIPLTAGVTILGSKKVGDRVNLECDMIGKYVEKLLKYNGNGLDCCGGADDENNENKKKDISLEFLASNGFF